MKILNWLFNNNHEKNVRSSSLEELINILECAQKSQQEVPYIIDKGEIKNPDPEACEKFTNCYVSARVVVDMDYEDLNGARLKIKDAKPQEIIKLIKDNFSAEDKYEKRSSVIETIVEDYLPRDRRAKDCPLRKLSIFYYNINEITSKPGDDPLGYRKIYRKTGKSMQIMISDYELEWIGGRELYENPQKYRVRKVAFF